MSNNISRDDLDELINYLKNEDPKLTHGPKVQEFEMKWSEWLGVKHSVMVNSGSSANDLTLLALREFTGLGEVIVPPLTWVSDIASVLHAGFTPKFVDISRESLALDDELVLKAITPKTKAVFLTHILGFDGLTDRLLEELKRLNIKLIEDVCESHGATHNGRKLGTFGWASNFSFYYAHHLTTIEGGMICTDNDELTEIIRMMRSHGLLRESTNSELKTQYKLRYPELNQDFIFTIAAHNMRPTEINGILGLSQLLRLDANNLIRISNFEYFLDNLDRNKYRTNLLKKGNSNYAFTVILKDANFELRNKIEALLSVNAIEFRRGLSGGGNQLRQPYLKRYENIPNPENFKETEHVHHFGWYIGNSPTILTSDIDELINLLNNA
jgi:CDP-6-deoxy-D-xylo-4-hexulose-3-dehydrase